MLALISLFLMGDGFIMKGDHFDDEAAPALPRELDGSRDPDGDTSAHRAGRPGCGPDGRAGAGA